MNEEKDMADARTILAGYRASIDNIDAALIRMLAERFRMHQGRRRAARRNTRCPPSDPSARGTANRQVCGSWPVEAQS